MVNLPSLDNIANKARFQPGWFVYHVIMLYSGNFQTASVTRLK